MPNSIPNGMRTTPRFLWYSTMPFSIIKELSCPPKKRLQSDNSTETTTSSESCEKYWVYSNRQHQVGISRKHMWRISLLHSWVQSYKQVWLSQRKSDQPIILTRERWNATNEMYGQRQRTRNADNLRLQSRAVTHNSSCASVPWTKTRAKRQSLMHY